MCHRGVIGSIYDLWQGDPAKKQENQLAALGGYQTGVGEGLTTAGATFDEAILSGDQGRISQALAPEISAGQQQVQQQKNQDAQFAPRSGGTAASTANAETAERGNLINLEGGLQSGTAGSALGAGSNLLSQASGNINDVAGLRTARQARSAGDWGNIAQGAAEIAAPFFPEATPPTPEMAPQLTDLAPEMGAAPPDLNPYNMPGFGSSPDLSVFQ